MFWEACQKKGNELEQSLRSKYDLSLSLQIHEINRKALSRGHILSIELLAVYNIQKDQFSVYKLSLLLGKDLQWPCTESWANLNWSEG